MEKEVFKTLQSLMAPKKERKKEIDVEFDWLMKEESS